MMVYNHSSILSQRVGFQKLIMRVTCHHILSTSNKNDRTLGANEMKPEEHALVMERFK